MVWDASGREASHHAARYPHHRASADQAAAMAMNSSFGRAYQRLWAANALSAVGTGMTTAALPLLASIKPPSELLLGTIAAAGLLPGVLLAVPAGLVADRYDRGRVLVVADLGRAVVVAAAAIALLLGSLPGFVLAAITFLIGAGETVFITASQSAIPSFVAADQLDDANGRLQAADDVGREFVGPPLGSLIFRLATWIPFVADAVSYLVSAVLLLRLPRTPPAPVTELHQRPTMAPAWAYFRSSRTLVVLGGAMFTLSLCGSAVLAMLVLLVRNQFSLDVGWFGPALTVIAFGATLAGLLAGRLRARIPARWAISGAVAVNGLSYVALGTTTMWPIAAVALFAWGFAVTLGNITSVGIRQRVIPGDLIGRVMGIFRAALGAGGVIGALGEHRCHGGRPAATTGGGSVGVRVAARHRRCSASTPRRHAGTHHLTEAGQLEGQRAEAGLDPLVALEAEQRGELVGIHPARHDGSRDHPIGIAGVPGIDRQSEHRRPHVRERVARVGRQRRQPSPPGADVGRNLDDGAQQLTMNRQPGLVERRDGDTRSVAHQQVDRVLERADCARDEQLLHQRVAQRQGQRL